MNFEQLTKAMNGETYIIVLDKEESYRITNGPVNTFAPKNIFDVLKDTTVLKIERMTKEALMLWGMDLEQEAYIVVVDKY